MAMKTKTGMALNCLLRDAQKSRKIVKGTDHRQWTPKTRFLFSAKKQLRSTFRLGFRNPANMHRPLKEFQNAKPKVRKYKTALNVKIGF